MLDRMGCVDAVHDPRIEGLHNEPRPAVLPRRDDPGTAMRVPMRLDDPVPQLDALAPLDLDMERRALEADVRGVSRIAAVLNRSARHHPAPIELVSQFPFSTSSLFSRVRHGWTLLLFGGTGVENSPLL